MTQSDQWSSLRDGRFGSKVGQIGPQIGQNRDFFRSDFSAFGAGRPFGTNLTNFGAKPTIPVPSPALDL